MRPPVVKSDSSAPVRLPRTPSSASAGRPDFVSDGCRLAVPAPNTYGGSRSGMTRAERDHRTAMPRRVDLAALETFSCPRSCSFKANGLGADAPSSYGRARRGAGHLSIRSLEERDGRPFKRARSLRVARATVRGLGPTRVAIVACPSFFVIGSRLDIGLDRPLHQLARNVAMSNARPRFSMK